MIRKILSMTCLGAMLVALPNVHAQSTQNNMDLPDDIDAESLTRLPALSREDLDEEGKAAYDYVVGDGPKPTSGPGGVSLYSPTLAKIWHDLNQYLRNDSVVERKYFELASILGAWEIGQQYEYAAHEPAALRFGISQAAVDAVKLDREPEGATREETVIIHLARQILRDHHVDSALYAEAVELFGEQGLVELVTIMGDYIMVGMVLTTIDQRLPADRPALLPAR
jgi:4-carboxymuconolactone decarboxylase